VTELDHLVLPVTDLDVAAAALTDAGFVVTPEAPHPFGTANRLVVFEQVYVELVTVADPVRIPDTGFARLVADHLEAGRGGFSHVACRATTVGDAGSEIRAAGLEAGEPMWFSRPAPRTDGSELTASFTLLGIVGHPHQFFCVHHTPEAVWFRPHLLHPNGARRIEHVSSRLTPVVPMRGVTDGADRIVFDVAPETIEMSGVRLG
jgi:hypothetical protein